MVDIDVAIKVVKWFRSFLVLSKCWFKGEHNGGNHCPGQCMWIICIIHTRIAVPHCLTSCCLTEETFGSGILSSIGTRLNDWYIG